MYYGMCITAGWDVHDSVRFFIVLYFTRDVLSSLIGPEGLNYVSSKFHETLVFIYFAHDLRFGLHQGGYCESTEVAYESLETQISIDVRSGKGSTSV